MTYIGHNFNTLSFNPNLNLGDKVKDRKSERGLIERLLQTLSFKNSEGC